MPALQRRLSYLLLLPLALSASSALAADAKRPILNRVAPVYPEIAKRMHVSGTVTLLVTIGTDGKVAGTKVESGHTLLVSAAETAVRQWRFAPSSESSESTIAIDFTDGGH